MLPVILAGASAVVWGAADYCGGVASLRGVASRRDRALTVALLSHLCAIPVILPLLLVLPGRPTAAALTWGALAGVASLIGVVTLNIGLASGAMSTFAPITAVSAAMVPFGGGLLMGERPALAAVVGAAAAVVAIILVSSGSPARGERELIRGRMVGLALVSGVAFGLFFLLLAQAGKDAGMWPLLADKVASVLMGLIVLRSVGLRLGALRGARPVLLLAAFAGACDTVATGLYLVSSHMGHVSVVAPVAALYPASTVVLAMIFRGERLRPVQFAGLGLAGVALVLTAS